MTTRAVFVSPGFTVLDHPVHNPRAAVHMTPGEVWSAGFGALLDRVAAGTLLDPATPLDREGVLVLDPSAIRSLKLPAGPGDGAQVALDEARAAGWLHGKPAPWMTFYGEGKPTIIVGLMSWPEWTRKGSITDGLKGPVDIPCRLALWHDLTGHAWRGSPGIAGMTVLRETLPQLPIQDAHRRPSLKLKDGPDDAYELDWSPDDWSRPLEDAYAHGYDATRMYLAAAGGLECLAPWGLKHTGRRKFSPKLAGWWLVSLGPWNETRIPAPAGPGDEDTRWVTTPTVELLAQLRERGEAFQDFEIRDSWTAPGRRVLRRWAEVLEHTYQSSRSIAEMTGEMDPWEDGEAVRVATKSAYRETWGLLKPSAGPENAVTWRPDWHYSGIAYARSTLWRKLWRVGLTEDRWPLEIDTDHVWYGSNLADPVAAMPKGLPLKNAAGLTDALGTFKVKGKTRERGKA